MKKFKNIAIYSSKRSKSVIQIAFQVIEILQSQNINVFVSKSSSIPKNQFNKLHTDTFILENSDLVIAIGGDGTLLSASRIFGSKGLPLLGINLGNLGFLTDIPPQELTKSINSILSGGFVVDERIFLEARLNEKRIQGLALNEAVIHSGSVAQLIEYELQINDKLVYRQKADGIIISTSTGSTGYSLSGDGPILHPNVKGIVLNPMFPHTLNSRPLIVDDSSKIKISIVGKRRAMLSLDSHNFTNLKKGTEVFIQKSPVKLKLIHPLDHDFFSASRNKLGWSLDFFNPKET